MTVTGNTVIKNGVPVCDVVKGTPSVSLGETPKLTKVEQVEPKETKRFVRKK
jgi:hypothetical protein